MKVVCIGESLIDFKDTGHLNFQGFVGGSPLNVAVATSRLGGSVAFASNVSTDMVGESIINFMMNNEIDFSCKFQSARYGWTPEKSFHNHDFSFVWGLIMEFAKSAPKLKPKCQK